VGFRIVKDSKSSVIVKAYILELMVFQVEITFVWRAGSLRACEIASGNC